MATYTGTLKYIAIEDGYCCLSINTGTSTSYALLWSFSTGIPTAAQKVVHNQWLNLCRDAILNGKTIAVTTSSTSSLATFVRLDA